MAVLRAKLGITVEKSGVEPSGSVGMNPKSPHTCTDMRSKVWPEETMVGSNIKDLAMGHTNSEGGTASAEDGRWKDILHRRGFPSPPMCTNAGVFSMN